jgi:hypothetical protein
MFVETIVAVFLFGLIAGATLIELARCGPLRAQNLALKQRQADRSWEAEKDAIRYQAYKRHLGTPYRPDTRIASLPPELDALIACVEDNDRWSRKTPSLEVVR